MVFLFQTPVYVYWESADDLSRMKDLIAYYEYLNIFPILADEKKRLSVKQELGRQPGPDKLIRTVARKNAVKKKLSKVPENERAFYLAYKVRSWICINEVNSPSQEWANLNKA